MTSTLPQYVLDMIEFHPVEDLSLAIFRDAFPTEINVNSLVADEQEWPLVLLRRGQDWGNWGGDARGFVDTGTLYVHTFCEGIESDSDAAYLAEACRVVLRRALDKPFGELGHLKSVQLMASPRRVTDFATATGPVQYASLPSGVTRYESTYALSIRMPRG